MSRLRFLTLFALFTLMAFSLSGCFGGGSGLVPAGWSGLAVGQDTAYVAYKQFVYAIRTSDGQQVWRYPADKAVGKLEFYSSPVLTEDGQVIVGAYNNVLYSLDSADGTEKWKFAEAKDRFIASPLVKDGKIFAPNADGKLYALDMNGKPVWEEPFDAGKAIWAQPVTDEKCTCIYLATLGHQLYSVDAATGKKNWGPVDLGSAAVGSPALSAEGTLYIGTYQKEMVAVNAGTGDTLWRVATDGWVWAGPVLKDDRLYFGDIDGNFYVLNLQDQKIIKKDKPDGPITSSPWIENDTVFFTTESGTIFAVDLDGNPKWNMTVGGKIHSSAVASEDLILVAPVGTDPVLVAVNDSGTQKWAFTPAK